jgi:hypothetical protein
MTKTQLLILLLILALIFYYLNEDKTDHHQKKPPIINQVRPEPPKLTPPQLKLGLNPPHSQLDEPSQPPTQPEPPSTLPKNPEEEPLKVDLPGPQYFTEDDNSLNETYRQHFLTLLQSLPLTHLTQQATQILQVSNKPLSTYYQAL